MTSLPDDFIARFGSNRDLMFFPTDEFLVWAGQKVFAREDENEEDIPYFVRKMGSTPELKRLENEQHQVMFVGTNSESVIGNNLDSEILESAKKPVKRDKWREVHVYNQSKVSGEPPKDPSAFYVDSEFLNLPPRRGFIQKGEGTNAQILSVWTPDGAGLTPGGAKAIADDIFQIDSTDTEWFIGFASAPPDVELVLEFIDNVTNPAEFSTTPEYCYYVSGSTVWANALKGTGGDYLLGKSTGAEWFFMQDFGTDVQQYHDQQWVDDELVTTGIPLLQEGTNALITPLTLSINTKFEFSFTGADMVDTSEDNAYDCVFLFRGEPGSATDFIAFVADDEEGNPGARSANDIGLGTVLELLVNVGAHEILVF